FLNRIWLLENGKIGGFYDKVHLVPFGEYLPLAGIIQPFFSGLTEEIGNFSTTQQKAMPIGDMGVLICFESVFPGMARDLCNRGAAYLINASNDAWFKTWSTPEQHLEMTCFRSIETRRWLLSSVNHGISAVISPGGRVVKSIGLLKEGFIVHDITLYGDSTFYTRFGPVIPFFWAGITLIAALTRRKPGC
ncbi:apolipoprotein N-acyltransferase, partial [bacterium]|nr:apolipoprotein N-acyltransferase [bacterium]